jgi:hypothetical protein
LTPNGRHSGEAAPPLAPPLGVLLAPASPPLNPCAPPRGFFLPPGAATSLKKSSESLAPHWT